MLRAARHWVLAGVTDAALRAAPGLSARAVDRLGGLLGRLGPRCPVIARQVAENMRRLGVYSAEAHRQYFAELGGHFAGALHALRCAGRADAAGMAAELAEVAAERIELDESVERLRCAVRPERGAILMGPLRSGWRSWPRGSGSRRRCGRPPGR